jgi:hypothetical protein
MFSTATYRSQTRSPEHHCGVHDRPGFAGFAGRYLIPLSGTLIERCLRGATLYCIMISDGGKLCDDFYSLVFFQSHGGVPLAMGASGHLYTHGFTFSVTYFA